jgi:hypothetical protein
MLGHECEQIHVRTRAYTRKQTTSQFERMRIHFEA